MHALSLALTVKYIQWEKSGWRTTKVKITIANDGRTPIQKNMQ